MKKQLLIGFGCCACVLPIGILIGHFGIPKTGSSSPSWASDVVKDVDEKLITTFLSEVDNVQIEEYLR